MPSRSWLLLLLTLLVLKSQRSSAYYLVPPIITETRFLTRPYTTRPCFVQLGQGDKAKSAPALPSDTSAPTSREQSAKETRSGLLVLLTVPVAWGTFEPVVRYVYEIDPPIPPFVFSQLYYLVAAVTLLAASFLSSPQKKDKAILSSKEENTDDWSFSGGFELGLYLFLGNALQVLGLKTIPSDRAAFLLQLTTIFVPLMEAFLARNIFAVSTRIWIACAVALIGVGVMGLDNGPESPVNLMPPVSMLTESFTAISSGDLFIVGAAVAYTFHCIRLEGYAKTTSAVKLAASKAVTETLLTSMSIVCFILYSSIAGAAYEGDNIFSSFAAESGRDITSYIESFSLSQINSNGQSIPGLLPGAAAAILWTGWVTVAYTIYAQSYGQRRVRPVTANLIYTIQPVCTAIFAWLLLGETLGAAGYFGGTLIGSAVLLITTAEKEEVV